jgi:hypothetical protein
MIAPARFVNLLANAHPTSDDKLSAIHVSRVIYCGLELLQSGGFAEGALVRQDLTYFSPLHA